jgi:uncharacterized surface protein with fasciclin (FAS1) repeats
MRSRSIAVAAASIGLAVAACGSGQHTASPVATRSALAGGSPIAIHHGVFGRGCTRIPATGPGSLSEMKTAPAATAAAHNPLLQYFSRAVGATGLTDRLNSAKAITVFAPDNAAFLALGPGNLATLKASKSDLTRVLEDHVVSGRKTPATLASHKHLTTLRGTVIIPSRTAAGYVVNNAGVVCGNIKTANATIYIVDKVLVPIP